MIRRVLLGLSLGVVGASSALAQDPGGSTETMGSTDQEVPPDFAAQPEPDMDASRSEVPDLPVTTQPLRDATDPWEDPHEGYYFVGAFYRHVILPEFLVSLFADEAFTSSNPGFGAELTYRKDNFDIVASAWWASYSAEGPFRSSGDALGETEWIDSALSVLYVSVAFLWSTPLNDIFALEYGVDFGLGLVLGGLDRREAWDSPTGSGNNWQPCNGLGDPRGPGNRCGDVVDDERPLENNPFEEEKWSGGGSIPNLFPWLAIPHLALRIKPIHQLMMRIEGGFGIGFFFGGSISYGI